MIEILLGSQNSERVLLFILAREKGYAAEISRFYDTAINGIQQQLEKFENGGVLVSQMIGRTRLYSFNPRYPFLIALKQLLSEAISFYPKEDQEKLLLNRRRPRRKGKPLK